MPIDAEIQQSSTRQEQPVQYLLLAIWFGLFTGLTEVTFLAVKKFFLYRFIWVGTDVIWMAPVTNIVLFAIPGLSFLCIARRWPRLASLRNTSFVFAFLGFSSLLVMSTRLHLAALLLLAIGLAVQTARLIASSPHRFNTLVRWTLGWTAIFTARRQQNNRGEEDHCTTSRPAALISRRHLLLSSGTTVVGLALGVHGWQILREHRALAKLHQGATNLPNVLMIVLDTVRASNLTSYGYSRFTTPQLQRLAETGVLFEFAISTAPWTLPSHASMFTGRFPHELSADWLSPLDGTDPTLAEVLREHGYVTAGFVANMLYCTYEQGLQRGFLHFEDYSVSPGEFLHCSSLAQTLTNSRRFRRIINYYDVFGRKTAANVNQDFLHWLSRTSRRPFFTFLNYFDAHEPYLPPPPFATQFGNDALRDHRFLRYWGHEASRTKKEKMSPQEIQAEIDAYDGTIAYLDHHLSRLFDELKKRGELANTLVIITSDHGEAFGEHGLFSHGNGLYLPTLRVPLLLWCPDRIPAGRRVHDPVTLRDIPATVVDLLGLERAARFEGRSLARYWESEGRLASEPPSPILSELSSDGMSPEWKGAITSLVTDGMHYIKNGDGREELYDLTNDPFERHNVAGVDGGRRSLDWIRASFESLIDGRPSAN